MDKLWTSAIEGRIIDPGYDLDVQLQVDDDEDNWEDICSWVVNNLPKHGTYVRIVIMSFPEV